MFSKKHRLNLASTKVKGTRWKGQHLTLIQDSTKSPFQVGVIISKKIAPLAVHRNQLRRRLLHSFKTSGISLEGLGLLLILPHSTATAATYQDLKKDTKSLLARVGQNLAP